MHIHNIYIYICTLTGNVFRQKYGAVEQYYPTLPPISKSWNTMNSKMGTIKNQMVSISYRKTGSCLDLRLLIFLEPKSSATQEFLKSEREQAIALVNNNQPAKRIFSAWNFGNEIVLSKSWMEMLQGICCNNAPSPGHRYTVQQESIMSIGQRRSWKIHFGYFGS